MASQYRSKYEVLGLYLLHEVDRTALCWPSEKEKVTIAYWKHHLKSEIHFGSLSFEMQYSDITYHKDLIYTHDYV